MWIWKQAAGELWRNGKLIAKGYSGHGDGVNNPSMQAVHKVGPIPRGRWRFVVLAGDLHTGPYSIIIMPCPGTVTYDRDGFRGHGDNSKGDRSASEGCIILARAIRVMIWTSGDHDLEVVA
jgi:hypothetical protein